MEWQPDWSEAPSNARFWTKSLYGSGMWLDHDEQYIKNAGLYGYTGEIHVQYTRPLDTIPVATRKCNYKTMYIVFIVLMFIVWWFVLAIRVSEDIRRIT